MEEHQGTDAELVTSERRLAASAVQGPFDDAMSEIAGGS